MPVPARPPPGLDLALFAAVAAVGWAAILARLAGGIPPEVMAAWRLALAAAAILPLALGASFRTPVSTAPGVPRPSTARVAAWVAAAGALLAVHFVAWFRSLELTSIASSVTLATTTPLWAAVLAPRVLGEPTPRATWWGLALALTGALLLGGSDLLRQGPGTGPSALLGDALALGAALAASAYLMIGRALRHALPLGTWFGWVTAAAAAFLVVASSLRGHSLTGFPPQAWLALLGLALVPHLLGHGLLNLAGRHMPAQRVQIALLGEPLFSVLYAWLLFAEAPTPLYWPAAAMVIAGVWRASPPPPASGPARR
ncbi:DMT family transporter [Myxococcota bacterium]|nr:DMT family transporter [Myxococcota bacterium]